MLYKVVLLMACLSLGVAAQETDEKGNYLLNLAPVTGKVQMSIQAAGGMWRVEAETLPGHEEPNPNSKVVKTFRRGDLIQANAGSGGSDEGLLNAKDAQGNPWMGCRDRAGNDLNCWVRANNKSIKPIMTESELAGAGAPPKKMTRPRKEMADIQDGSRTDEKGLPSLRPYVVQLESMIRWEAMEDAWAARRDAWAQQVLAAKYVTNLAPLVLELEGNTRWEAVDPSWAKTRDGWIKKVKAARSRKALGDLLQNYESALQWEYVQEDWKGARDGWIENVVNAGKR